MVLKILTLVIWIISLVLHAFYWIKYEVKEEDTLALKELIWTCTSVVAVLILANI